MAQLLYNEIDCTPVVDLVVPAVDLSLAVASVDNPSGCSSLAVVSWI